jgi:ParB family chromosome partitioning protein
VLRASEEQSNPGGRKPAEKSRDLQRLEEELSDALATQVSIKLGAKNRGQVLIDFADLDALDGLIARLRN